MKTPLEVLLPYQKRWVADEARFKMGLWARQTGKTFACAAEAVRDCLSNPSSAWVVLSRGERQALEFMEKAKLWAEAFDLAVEEYREERDGTELLLKAAEVRWANRSRMIALPANPNTARGYSAHVVLDEFAFHEKPELIWRAIFPVISNPLKAHLKLRIVSTPNGQGNKFYDLWTKNPHYSKHRIDIYESQAQGLAVNIDELRGGLDDPDGWAQEYECQFIDTTAVLLPYDLINTCESPDACEALLDDLQLNNTAYLGVDIGRKHDLTVAWLLERLGDVMWTRGLQTFEKTPYREQEAWLSALLTRHPRIQRCAIDATGIGAMLAENLSVRHGQRVKECTFTQAFKQELFPPLRLKLEDKQVRIPVSRVIREDLHGLQKVTSASGTIRFLAPHNADGHCDRATALALACYAADSAQPVLPPQRLPIGGMSRHRARAQRTLTGV